MDKQFSLKQYSYSIAKELIAQKPAKPRDGSRLLVVERKSKTLKQLIFKDILSFIEPGDLLVLNNTEVIRARLIGKTQRGGKVEVLLLKEKQPNFWEVLVKPGKRARLKEKIIFGSDCLAAEVIEKTDQGGRLLKFETGNFKQALAKLGQVPLPPYIKGTCSKDSDYQTVYAKEQGAVAAPTAGLHFTRSLLKQIKAKGAKIAYLTLHCGLATFRPIKTEDIREHKIESEWINVSQETADLINETKQAKGKIIAVGTTAIRTLESVGSANGRVKPFSGETSLYIVPGYKFKIVDRVITNFHTPASTNLVLLSAFCGLGLLKLSYAQAQASNFRFFSFGDAMLIL